MAEGRILLKLGHSAVSCSTIASFFSCVVMNYREAAGVSGCGFPRHYSGGNGTQCTGFRLRRAQRRARSQTEWNISMYEFSMFYFIHLNNDYCFGMIILNLIYIFLNY